MCNLEHINPFVLVITSGNEVNKCIVYIPNNIIVSFTEDYTIYCVLC